MTLVNIKQFEVLHHELGGTIDSLAEKIVEAANQKNAPVAGDFNGRWLIANPGDHPQVISDAFMREIEVRTQEYQDSDEYKESERKRREKELRQQSELTTLLNAAPAMEFTDEAAWQEGLKNNPDGYGRAVYQFAENWARLMQAQIAQGRAVAECAADCERLPASVEGLSGFQYGCALSVLAHCWTHGEDLRIWHNLRTQLKNEGERANESGGVLNPAILCVGGQP